MAGQATVTVAEAPPVSDEWQPLGARGTSAWSPTWRAWLTAALPVAALILIPVAIFAGAALILGHPLLVGDNLIQNFPLRVLVGTDLRHGRLPLWDPWIWSGAPLMAGLNAGAFYPTTFLFAFMPATAAWVLGQILVVSSISVGTFAFLRATGTDRLPSFLGAASFAFAGAVAGQGGVHIDMEEGFASLPWMLLAVRHIIDDGRWRWSFLLAVAMACLILAGAPEAMLDVTILSLTYAILRLCLHPPAWRHLLSRAGAGYVMGMGVSAFVWLPALHFIATSQRASLSSAFVGSYSFPARAFVLGLVPYLEGGWTLVSQPPYFGPSNLPEVAFYVGLLPFIAALALAGRRWAGWLPRGERRTWYVIGLVGLVLAVAGGTPLEHLLIHIPFYGKQRDQGRNIVDVDFAACVLFAWWLDGGRRPEGVRTTSETVAAVGVGACVAAVLVWLLVAPASLWSALSALAPSAAERSSIETAAVVSVLLAVVAAALVLSRPRWARTRWLSLVAVFVTVDVGLFASGATLASSRPAPTASSPGPLLRMVKDNLSVGGRYAVFDPDGFYPSGIVAAGEADLGVLLGLPSVQGYGSIVAGNYALRTGTHLRGYLTVGELNAGYFRPLGLQVMLAPAEEFLFPLAAMPRAGATADLEPTVERAGVDPLLSAGDYVPPQERLPELAPTPPRAAISQGERVGWFFGTLASPVQAALVLSRPAAGQVVRVGELRSSGAISWQPPQRLATGASVVSLGVRAVPSTGVVLQLLSGSKLGPLQLTIGADGHAYVVDSTLARVLTPVSWTEVGEADHFAVFRNYNRAVQAWVQPLRTYEIAPHLPAAVTVLSESTDTATIAVRTPRPSLLVRSSAWDPGWEAEIVSAGAASRDLPSVRAAPARDLLGAESVPVNEVGVLQSVDIPSGLSIVRFTYEPEGFGKGLAISAATVLATLAGLVLVASLGRRRRRLRTEEAPFGR